MMVELLVVMMSIGRTSKKMRSEFIGLSYFLLFLVLYAKGRENYRGQQLFRRHGQVAAVGASCSYPLRVDFSRLRV